MTYLSVGCKSAPATNPSSATQQHAAASSIADTRGSAESPEQKDAQRVWCEYLDALHRRAGVADATMPSFQKCLEARTYAAPQMLRQTARCSREALDHFEGDPFTREYAATVARCGSTALDSCEAQRSELEPFIVTICSCVDRCGGAEQTECIMKLDGGLNIHLSRAVGALNDRGRQAFQTCLTQLSCGEVGSQIIRCLDPIMEGLLWLPE